ncbi:MAG: 30S ribosomal protein S1 [Candidatus Omnitrophica bacterium]|nr:30S ribosomal protein S1 [Candidatus Omnitrophota bacterium]MDD5042700.1 30S ribosomal protein S1 [Candidatus Omnitrophota bacterium]MDD5501572.1 30S ribosomal protein S1 [Candidatus Omnitrophota bacterium]
MSSTTREELEQLYNQSIKEMKEGQVVTGKIVGIKNKEVLVDVGFKSEGIVPITEFNTADLEMGREMEFLLENMENDAGVMTLSREKAMRMQGWDKIVKISNEGSLVEGKPVKKVKGGFLVDIMGIEGFLPSSLSAFRNIPDKDILYKVFKFKIVKVNNLRRSIIVSRREAVQADRDLAKSKIWSELKIGNIYPGTVKAITDFGAFIDLGGVDGLLHITDMSWSKISHPSEIVAIGDKIEIMVLNMDQASGKVSLGLKQRQADPWQDIENKFSVGAKVKGKVVNILPYGIFVELEKGIEGLVHVSEISWTKRVNNPGEMFAVGDILETQILSVEKDSRRISLSLKQLEQNPWTEAEAKYPVGSTVSGKVRGFTDYGAFVELDSNLEGMIHVSDLSWTKRIGHPQDVLKKGQKVDVYVLSVDASSRRIALGLKQLQENPWPKIAEKYPLDTVLEAEVSSITEFGVFANIDSELEGLIYSSEIDKEAVANLKPGDKVNVKIIKVDVEQAKIGLTARL